MHGVMTGRLNENPELCDKLIPKWALGCRRLTPGDGYLEALQEENCQPEFTEIVRITETGVQTKNSHQEFDLIICATGFDVSFKPFWDMVGRNGNRMEEMWAEYPEAYLAMCAHDQPNYFVLNGPNAPVAHGSIPVAIDFMCNYILSWVRKIAKEDIRYVFIILFAI